MTVVNPIPIPKSPKIQASIAVVLHDHVILLVSVLLIAIWGMSALAAFLAYDTGRDAGLARLLSAAQSLSRSVDAQVFTYRTALEVLASTPSFSTGDMGTVQAEAADMRRAFPGTDIIVAREDGQVLVHSSHPGGQLNHRTRMDLVGRVFRTQLPSVSGVFRGPRTGRFLVSIDVPVIRDGKTRYDLALLASQSAWIPVLEVQNLPTGWTASIIDGDGVRVARTIDAETYVGTVVGGSFRKLWAEGGDGVRDMADPGEDELEVAFAHAPVSGFTAVVGVPRASFAFTLMKTEIPIWTGLFLIAAGLSWFVLRQGQGILRSGATAAEMVDEQQTALSVFTSCQEGIAVTDATNRIIEVNPAFTNLTGYTLDDVKGSNPKVLSAGRTSLSIYEQMWSDVREHGSWQGELLNRRKTGEEFYAWLTISAIRDQKGVVSRYVGMFSDVSEWKKAQDVIVKQANFDTLTGLPNRRLFRDRLDHEMRKIERGSGELALMFIDLDRFKEVNDTLGHDGGDQLLVEASRRMSACVRAADTVARLGGDEFAVILASMPSPRMVERVASALNSSLAAPFVVGSTVVHVSASIGITFYPSDAQNSELLMKCADQAMYSAKSLGRDRFCWFTPSMQKEAEERLQLANDLRVALADDGLMVHYQPIVDMTTGQVVKGEALVRWLHPTLGNIPPSRFIPIAEETGQINALGNWVFRQAAMTAKRWVEVVKAGGDLQLADRLSISVNKSPKQFSANNTFVRWTEFLHEIDLSPKHLVIEITENLFMGETVDIATKLRRFRDVGMAVSLDDFGTGYSSLNYLKKYEVDYLKMDQSFVRGMLDQASDRAIAEAILAMAQRLNLDVVAEGIETEAQRDFLVQAGCRYGQGYLFARALDAEHFIDFAAATQRTLGSV